MAQEMGARLGECEVLLGAVQGGEEVGSQLTLKISNPDPLDSINKKYLDSHYYERYVFLCG